MSDVFISHVKENAGVVLEIAEGLEAVGYTTWYYERDILPGRSHLEQTSQFDTSLDGKPLAWLAHFLAPMQDGEFREGQLSHPIGASIFVFAGGRFHSAADFDTFGAQNADEFRDAKGPDFKSRLRATIDILGPNPCPAAGAGVAACDEFSVIRRAILLRSFLDRYAPRLMWTDETGDKRERLHIDHGVLQAFLTVSDPVEPRKVGGYRHGARSMESIVQTSHLAGQTSFEPSCLPALSQLNVHTYGECFLERSCATMLSSRRWRALSTPSIVLPAATWIHPMKNWRTI